ncbi:MAG: carboxypeptidase regulatory-like domain-containing protein [Vicinamibacterales bacterium]
MKISRCVSIALAAGCLIGVRQGAASAQAPRGRLVVTVMDQSRAVIPNATVTVTGEDETAAGGPRVVSTSPVGVATIEDLAAGRYTIRVEFPGFQAVVVEGHRVGSGTSRRSLVLPIEKLDEKLTVERDKQMSALDPRGAAFSTVLTREQIEALPDDPEEMEKALKAMAPPGSTIRVDGFTGGKLPPKSQIRSIRLPRMDMMAAQNHGGMAGMHFIDIMTQPGAGPLRGSVDFAFRNDALNARNPFAPEKGDEGLQRYGFTLGGTVKPNRSSFSLTVQRTGQHDTGNLLAAVPGRTRAEPVRQPSSSLSFTGRFDQAIGTDHTLRASVQRSTYERNNLGIGGFDLPERAFSTVSSDTVFRLSENGPLGRRFFWESRLQVHAFGNDNRSVTESPTIRVLDSFTSGGAQQSGGSHATEFELASDLDYVRGIHSFRTGFLLEGGRYRSDETSNYLGTFTFTSMEDYLAGRPALYTRRIGDPLVRYSNLQLGLYVQDDVRVRRSVMLSLGVRYEAQTMASDAVNFSPRASLTWSPFKTGSTTFRASAGLFSDWLQPSTYRQTLQVDGFRQRELQVREPGYPDPGISGFTPPTNRYLLGEATSLPSSVAASFGVDRQLAGALRLSAAYTYRRGWGLLRGANLNPPGKDGARADPFFANVVEVRSDAASRSHAVNVGASMFLIDWHRTLFAANYSFTDSESNTVGPFSLPAWGDDLDREWGPSASRHRLGAQFSTQIVSTLGVSLSARAQSGSPYNITTGLDANGDGFFNDRPEGTPRNSAWTPWQWDVGARLSYAIGFGQRPPDTSGGGRTAVMVTVGGAGGGMPAAGVSVSGQDDKRYRIEFYVAAQNVTNRSNYAGYSGVMTSPFFGKPTTVLNPRKIEAGARFGF